MKIYNCGLIIGRFQPLHKGHVYMIKQGLEICEKLVIFIGSAQEGNTEKNPYDFADRLIMISEVFKEEMLNKKLIVLPLVDLGSGDNPIWGSYVLGTFKQKIGQLPDVYISGCEKCRTTWFTDELAPDMDELRIARTKIPVSGTEVREALNIKDYNLLSELVPQKVYDYIIKKGDSKNENINV